MGSGTSQESYYPDFYNTALTSSCLLPDIGIDESLLRFSGTNSNVALQNYSSQLVRDVGTKLPDYIQSLGSALGPATSVPNAMGLGALVISMVMEVCLLAAPSSSSENSYSLLQHAFTEGKGSDIRDTLAEYLKRHRMYIRNDQRLVDQIKKSEKQLGGQLTRLKISMLQNGQMSTRGFKHWVNGAAFHVQMLIHAARLNTIRLWKRISRDKSDYDAVSSVINGYLQDLRVLLREYRTYKTSTTSFTSSPPWCLDNSCHDRPPDCYIADDEVHCEELHGPLTDDIPCSGSSLVQGYVGYVFSHYEPITGLEGYFTDIKNNLSYLISQHDAFTLPSERNTQPCPGA